jgi:hypothetical protein
MREIPLLTIRAFVAGGTKPPEWERGVQAVVGMGGVAGELPRGGG